MNDKIQSSDDNFRVRFITFIFLQRNIYIFIKKKTDVGYKKTILNTIKIIFLKKSFQLNIVYFNNNFYFKKIEL